MKDFDTLCTKCWAELTEGSVCAQCGYDTDEVNDTMFLPARTVLNGKYVVGAVEAQESDAVVYYGFDNQLEKPVVIRELYPNGVASRLEGNNDIHIRQKYLKEFETYKASFIKLWTTMQKMHSFVSATPVYDVFEENGTVYAIIEDMETISMREYLIRNEEGYIQWDSARLMFMPVITTLSTLHKSGIVHGSITPDNLVLCRDGKVRLKPFPIIQASSETSPIQFNENEGYTALEQYDNNHKIGPATDIYAFAACIYRSLVGANPPSAEQRETNDKLMIPNSIAENIPVHVIKALASGLQVYPEKRVKDIEDFRELLEAAPAVQAKAIEHEDIYREGAKGGYPDYVETAKPKKDGKRIAIVVVLSLLIVAAIGAAVYVIQFSGLVNNNKETTTIAPQTAQYTVPNFVDTEYTQSDIENNEAWTSQFSFEFVGEFSADTEEGIIFKQSIAPGESVEAKTKIVLTVSKGIQTEIVKDVGSLPLDEATKILEELGFKVSTVEVYNDGTHLANTVKNVTGMAPAAGSVVAVGEEIILQVYGEPQTTQPESAD